MKKISSIILMVALTTASMFSQSLLKGLVDTANSVKKTTDSVKALSKSSKKKVASKEEKKDPNETVPLKSLDAFMIYMNLSDTKITEDMNMEYAKTIGHETYEKYSKDEFEQEEKFAGLKEEFKNKVDNANVDGKFAVLLNFEFGDYDFEKEGYKLSISKDTYVPFDSIYSTYYSGYSIPRNSVLYKRIGLKLIGLEKYNLIPMPKDKAKEFLQARKDSSGYIDRRISILINYEIDSFNSDEHKAWSKITSQNGDLPLSGVISKIEVYDRNFNLIGELIQK